MKKLTKFMDDISKKDIELIELTEFKKGLFNLRIAAYRLEKDDEGKTFRYGIDQTIVLTENQVHQLRDKLNVHTFVVNVGSEEAQVLLR